MQTAYEYKGYPVQITVSECQSGFIAIPTVTMPDGKKWERPAIYNRSCDYWALIAADFQTVDWIDQLARLNREDYEANPDRYARQVWAQIKQWTEG
jgi:hypothetical protein